MANPESQNASENSQGALALSASENQNSAPSAASVLSRMQLQMILAHVAHGILVVDSAGVVTFENEAARRIMFASMLGKNVISELPPWTILDAERRPYALHELPLVRAVVNGETIDGEDMIVPISAEIEYVIQVSAAPIRDENGAQISAVLTLHDVTGERRTTRELSEANRNKDEFLAILSHELRTPLTPILGWASFLHRVGVPDHDVLMQAVSSIERNAEHLQRLVSDLLDTTRIVSGKMRTKKTRCDLNEMVRFAASSVELKAREDDIVLKCELAELPLLWLDRERIAQVLMNLLSNAVKFSLPGGVVHLRTKLRTQPATAPDETESAISSTRYATIEVEDNGIGIAPALLPHVFDLFLQGDSSSTRRHGGLGLGLAISKSLVEIHGGTLTAHSAGVGKGALFVVSLPVESS